MMPADDLLPDVPQWVLEADEQTLLECALRVVESSAMTEAGESPMYELSHHLDKAKRKVRTTYPDPDRRVAAVSLAMGNDLNSQNTSRDKWGHWGWIARFGLNWDGSRLERAKSRSELLSQDVTRSSGKAFRRPSFELNLGEVLLKAQLNNTNQLEVIVTGESALVTMEILLVQCASAARRLQGCEGFEARNVPVIRDIDGGMSILLGELKQFKTFTDSEVLSLLVNGTDNAWQKDLMPLIAYGLSHVLGIRSEHSSLTIWSEMWHSDSVSKRSQTDREWTSTLSMRDALRVLEEVKSEFSKEAFPAISALVLNARMAAEDATHGPTPLLDTSLPLIQLKEIANSETAELKLRLKQINVLLDGISGQRIKSYAELQDYVGSIQEIVRRGPFELLLAKKILNLEAGTNVTVTSEKPSTRYPEGRMIVYPVGQSDASKRRVSFFPLRIASSVR